MFAVDGCKISSKKKRAKEWSGTRPQLGKKAQKLEESVRAAHRAASGGGCP